MLKEYKEKLNTFTSGFGVLCQHSLKTDYTNAEWQSAEYLPKYKDDDKTQGLIFRILKTEYEQAE